MKKLKIHFIVTTFALFILSALIIPGKNVYAATAIDNPIVLQALLSTGGDFIITADMTLSGSVDINNDTILDLNGHTLDLGGNTINSWANFTVKDSSEAQTGAITSTASFTIRIGDPNNTGALILESGTIDCKGSYCVRNYGDIQMNGGAVNGNGFVIYNDTNSTMTMNGGAITAKTGVATQLQQNSTFVMNDGLIKTNASDRVALNVSKPDANFTMNGGRIEATQPKANGIALFKDTEVTINNGVVTSDSSAIIGNGSTSGSSEGTNAKVTVNGGEITSQKGPAIYVPQPNGNTTITGGVLTGQSGIEIRAGKLTITGGTLNATADEYIVGSNTSGTTTVGASVAVVQHVTQLPIDVVITGGNFNGVAPIGLANPEQTPEEAQAQITISITGGTYVGEIYEDLINNIDEGYVDVDENGAIIVMSEQEAAAREESEDEDFVPVPNTGANTADLASMVSLQSDTSARIVLATAAGIIVSIGSFIIIRRHRAKSE